VVWEIEGKEKKKIIGLGLRMWADKMRRKKIKRIWY